jgi:phytoene/squalene synthetase
MGSTALLSKTATPKEQLDFWKKSIEDLYDEKHDESSILQHPTLRLLRQLKHPSIGNSGSPTTTLSKCHFDDILKGRQEDLSIKQYATLEELEEHAVWSCGSLSQLVLEADGIFPEQHPLPHQAARLVGQAHGLTNALRLSIPIVSTTGRLIIPQDLCEKYGVKSPRYLLSALGQGDAGCTRALQRTVQEIVARARRYLQEARELRHDLFETGMVGEHSVAVLLPALTSETFLNRLEAHNFDLTDRNLRNVNMLEHARCASNLLHAAWLQKY